MSSDVLLERAPYTRVAPAQPCMSLQAKLGLGIIACTLATAAVAGSIIGVGASVGLVVGGSVFACMLLARGITSVVTKSEFIAVIGSIAVGYFAIPLGANVLMAYTGSTVFSTAMNIASRIVIPMLLANLLARAAAKDLEKCCAR